MTGEIILYTTEDGGTQIFLREINGTVWLTQAQLAELFDTTVSNINKHIKTIVEENEQPEATIEYHSIVQTESRDRLKAESQFEVWNRRVINEPSAVERHFDEAIKAAKRVDAGKKLGGKGKKDAS